MISFKIAMLCSYSIAIAVVIGLVRFQRITRIYRPFIYLIILSLLNEVVAYIFTAMHKPNTISMNIFFLVDVILWLWQFNRWGSFSKSGPYVLLISLMIATWVVENLVLGRLDVFGSASLLVFSIVLVFLSIGQINKLIVEERKNILKNARFLICTGILIFYSYSIMLETIYVIKFNDNNYFLSRIFTILVFVNLFVNLLYALAALWIPTRQRFTMQY